jgi:hypothetical protein
MKSEFRGCLTVDDQYASEDLCETLNTAMTLLRDTLEAPFVAVGLGADTSDPTAYVLHGQTLGQYTLLRRVDVPHIDKPYWTSTTDQPLSWLVEDLIAHLRTRGEPSVDHLDVAVIRDRLADAEFERERDRAVLARTEQEMSSRQMAFAGGSKTPGYCDERTTRPVYRKEDARDTDGGELSVSP